MQAATGMPIDHHGRYLVRPARPFAVRDVGVLLVSRRLAAEDAAASAEQDSRSPFQGVRGCQDHPFAPMVTVGLVEPYQEFVGRS